MRVIFALWIASTFLFSSCEDTWEKEGVDPGALHKGFAYDVLKERGNYSMFLEAVDKAGYNSLLKGKGLVTVMAPNDESFQAYLKKHNYSGVSDISPEDLDVLVGEHLLKYSYRKSDLLNFQPTVSGVGVIQPAGACYKHETFAKAPVKTYYDSWKNKNVKVLNREKYLPVFGSDFFQTMKITDPEGNYKYFYPNSNWSGDDSRLYPANANIVEYEIPTDNGYIHTIDQVIEPMRTVYSVLEDSTLNYSLFKRLYDDFNSFRYDQGISANYAETGDSLFLFEHMNEGRMALENIASEWSTNANYTEVLKLQAVNAFVPNNAAIEKFYNEYFQDPTVEDRYTSIENVDRLTWYYFLANHVVRNSPIFPDVLKAGVTDQWGSLFDFSPESDVEHKEVCGNGLFYGINKVQVPGIFTGVTKPVFQTPRYQYLQYMLMRSGRLPELANPDQQVTMLLLSTSTLKNHNPAFEVNMKDEFLVGDEGIYYYDATANPEKDAQWVSDFVGNYIVSELITPSDIRGSSDQRIFFETNLKDNFIYLQNGAFHSESGEVIEVDPEHQFADPNGNWYAYEINGFIQGETKYFMRVIDFDPVSGTALRYYTWYRLKVFKQRICKFTDDFNQNQDHALRSFESNRGIVFAVMDHWINNGEDRLKEGIGIPTVTNGVGNVKPIKDMTAWFNKHKVRKEENGKNFKLTEFMSGDEGLVGKTFHTMDSTFDIRIINVEKTDANAQIDGFFPGEYKLTIELPEQENNRRVVVYGPHFGKEAVFFVIPSANDRFVWEVKTEEPEE